MKKEQFLDIMDEIGDDLIENFLDIPGERIYVLKRTPFWKTALSAVAAVCILTAGAFAALKLYNVRIIPNDHVSESSSYTQSESSSIVSKFDTVITDGIDFSYLKPNFGYLSDPVIKNDDENYAVVYVGCRNISEQNPLYIAVKTRRNGEWVYVGKITVAENYARTYRIDYDSEIKKGDEIFLYLTTKSDEEARADGKWLP